MKIAVFSSKPYTQRFLEEANSAGQHELSFLEARLNSRTASLAKGFDAVCAFVNDDLGADTFAQLSGIGVRLVAMRCTGTNNVDLKTAAELGVAVVRVPSYSPHAIAEHTLALLLSLDRKIHRSHARVREGNFELEGLLGFDLFGRTVGVVGTGQIGRNVIRILLGFGCHVLAYDPYPNSDIEDMGARYVDLDELLRNSDIITLHCPLTPATKHIINQETIEQMKDKVTLINTSRGALIDTPAVIAGLKSGKISHLGLDVYEEEADLFFDDLSSQVLHDDVFARLLTFPNVVITGHQAFFTEEALANIAGTTIENVTEYEETGECVNAC